MKSRSNNKLIPRSLLKSLAGDIKHLMDSNEGRLFALEMMEEIPRDFRSLVIESLSGFHEKELAVFFHLLQQEYGAELERPISRALGKLRMAGVPVTCPAFFRGRFYRAYATKTRHLGQVTVDIAWETPHGSLDVECFFLTFGPEGIHSIFALSDVAASDFENDRRKLTNVVDISLKEAAFLIQQSYHFNLRHMTRPGPGRFLFHKYLDMSSDLTEAEVRELFDKLSELLSPQQLVNSFFIALRRQDHAYVKALFDEEKLLRPDFAGQVESVLNLGQTLVEGHAAGVKTSGRYAVVKARCITLGDEEVGYRELSFYLKKFRGKWFVSDVCHQLFEIASTSSDHAPSFFKIHCYVYEVLDVDELLSTLEVLDNIEEAGEIAGGIHLRIAHHEDEYSCGGFLLPGVWADLVIKGDEMVVMGKDLRTLEALHQLVTREHQVVLSSRHEISTLTAYRYLAGQYLSFDDVLAGGKQDGVFEDGMKFVSARYLVRDRNRVLAKLQNIANQQYDLPGNCQVFYQYRKSPDTGAEIFLAEYVFGNSWMTVSAYGDKEVSAVREYFEHGIQDCLQFEGLEIKEEGIFEVLTREIKAQYPNLEARLKKAYLDKWYFSKSKELGGLSPAQARESEEGQRRLWEMFKDMNQRRKSCIRQRVKRYLNLKEYLERVYL